MVVIERMDRLVHVRRTSDRKEGCIWSWILESRPRPACVESEELLLGAPDLTPTRLEFMRSMLQEHETEGRKPIDLAAKRRCVGHDDDGEGSTGAAAGAATSGAPADGDDARAETSRGGVPMYLSQYPTSMVNLPVRPGGTVVHAIGVVAVRSAR